MNKKPTKAERTKLLQCRSREVPPIEKTTKLVRSYDGREITLSLPKLRFMEKEDGL